MRTLRALDARIKRWRPPRILARVAIVVLVVASVLFALAAILALSVERATAPGVRVEDGFVFALLALLAASAILVAALNARWNGDETTGSVNA